MATPHGIACSPRERQEKQRKKSKRTAIGSNNSDNNGNDQDEALRRDARLLEEQLLVAFRGADATTTAAVLSSVSARDGATARGSASATGPSALRTALCFDALRHVATKFPRFDTVLRLLETELARAVYVSHDIKQQQQQAQPQPQLQPQLQPQARSRDDGSNVDAVLPGAPCRPENEAEDELKHATSDDLADEDDVAARAARIQRFFTRRTFFAQLHRVLTEKATLQTELEGLDRMRELMLLQLRHKELMVDRLATRWGRVLLKQTLVDWRQIIVRKKYTRVLLEKTSGRWSRQRLLRLFRRWADTTKAQKVARMSQKLQQCVETTRDLEDLLSKMDSQIDSARLDTKGHREHFDFAKRQIVSLEELLAQLETRVHSCNERKLQTLVNEWGRLCLAFVDVQVEYLQHMLNAVTAQEYVDVTGILFKGEELSDLVQLPTDLLVLRWINYQLVRCETFQHGHPKALASPSNTGSTTGGGLIQNFSTDMKNHYVLRHILKRIHSRREEILRFSSCGVMIGRRMSRFMEEIMAKNNSSGASGARIAPFPTREELRSALEEQLEPPCPPFLAIQVMETEMPSDLAFCLFSFLVCEHPTLHQLPPHGECQWKDAQTALDDAKSVWQTIRAQWTELTTPFEIREMTKTTPDLTSPPHLLVRANIALQNAVNMVQYACSKRSIVMKTWGCLQRKIHQDAMRLLMCRARLEAPVEMMDRRLWREKYMLTTLHFSKLVQAFSEDDRANSSAVSQLSPQQYELELQAIEGILCEHFVDLRRVYRYYASIEHELERTDQLLRGQKNGLNHRQAREEELFFRKISVSMSLMEFHVFLKDCRVFGSSRPFPYAFILRVFEQVNADVAAAVESATVLTTKNLTATPSTMEDAAHDGSATEMTAAEFVEALVHIAQSKHFRLKSNSAMSASLTLSQRFRRLLVEVVLPHAMQERDRVNVFHQQLMAADCRDVFTKHHKHLHAVYLHYAMLEHRVVDGGGDVPKTGKIPARRMLSANGFVAMLRHLDLFREHYLNVDDVQHVISEVLQLDRESVHVSMEVVAACVSAITPMNSALLADEPKSKIAASTLDEPLLLTYAEFLEACAAVACYLRPDAFVPLSAKLDDFFTEDIRLP
ncbi:hypothetical protein PINS_up012070 [Pythium insidiosum]|nr:hypothetical protein PINS_up012070 [Pythium insidiosum]